MLIWKSLKQLACVKESKEITNGMEYMVLDWTDKNIRLQKLHPANPDKNGEPFELSYSQCALTMRLQHALTYYSTQGRTLRDGPICLTNTDHDHFTKRHLIVGLSRSGLGRNVYIM